jgi:hypothetical protein
MSGDCSDLVRGAADFGEPTSACLAQSVRRESVGESSLIAHFAKPISESRRRKGSSTPRGQERKMLVGSGVNNFAQLRMYWNFQVRLILAFGLVLVDGQNAVTDMLAPKFDDITAPLRCVQQQ